jgi:Xaa-Pro aminopeptidase
MFFRDDMRAIADQARQKVLAACGESIDAVVTVDATHVGYLSGYRSVQLDVDRNYRCAAIIARGRTILIVGAADAAPALEILRDPSCIYRYGQFYIYSRDNDVNFSGLPPSQASFPEALDAAIKATLQPNSAVGVDAATAGDLTELRSIFANPVQDVRAKIIRARSVKTLEEIAKIRDAARITERGMEKAIRHAAVGVTEIELSVLVASEIRSGGGIPRFVVVTAGDRAALADAYASRAELKKGDLVRFDVGCTLDGYWADTARTIVVGKPTHEQQTRYDALLAGELAQFEIAKPGIHATDLFKVAVDTVRKGALPNYQRTHCGHGIGITAHEFPTLNTANHDVIVEEGMVFCVETPYYEVGWGGMMVEDMIVIRRDGPEFLTHLPRELIQV